MTKSEETWLLNDKEADAIATEMLYPAPNSRKHSPVYPTRMRPLPKDTPTVRVTPSEKPFEG